MYKELEAEMIKYWFSGLNKSFTFSQKLKNIII